MRLKKKTPNDELHKTQTARVHLGSLCVMGRTYQSHLPPLSSNKDTHIRLIQPQKHKLRKCTEVLKLASSQEIGIRRANICSTRLPGPYLDRSGHPLKDEHGRSKYGFV